MVNSYIYILDIAGYIASLTPTMKNQAKTRDYFFVYIKTAPTNVETILISNHRNMKIIRQKLLDAFYDKTPISASKVAPGKDVFYFNAYSFVNDISEKLSFDLNDADAVKLSDINDEGLVISVVGEIRFITEETQKTFFRNGRNKTERMREAVISDGSRTVKLTVWGFLIDLIKDNTFLQLVNISSRNYNEEIVLTTTYSSSVVYLTESLEIEFDHSVFDDNQVHVQTESFKLCCPSIGGIKLESFFSCNVCKSKLIVNSGTGLCTCTTCKRDYLTSSVNDSLKKLAKVDVITDELSITVTIYHEIMEDFFEKDPPKDENDLRVKLLNMKNVDFEINRKKHTVKKMIRHD